MSRTFLVVYPTNLSGRLKCINDRYTKENDQGEDLKMPLKRHGDKCIDVLYEWRLISVGGPFSSQNYFVFPYPIEPQ
jgi:hypothetical protein